MRGGYTVMPSRADDTDRDSPDFNIHRPKSRSYLTKFCIALLLLLLLATAVVSAVFVYLYVHHENSSSSSSSSSTSDVCVSEACLDLAVQIKGAMDESIDPCDDFYNFTCGNWPFFNHIPEGQYGTGALVQQQYAVYSHLAKILNTNFAGGNKVLTQLSNFYNSCIAAHSMNESEYIDKLVPVIRKFYHQLGGWSLVNISGDGTVWSVNSSQFIREKLTGSKAFYSLSIGHDDEARKYSLVLQQAGLTLSDPEMYNNTNSTDMLLSEMSTILSGLAQASVDYESIWKIFEFERNLSQIWQETTDDEDNPNSTYTVGELYKLWPYHDWLGVLKGVLGPSGVDISLSSNVTVGTPEYFKHLTQLVETTDNETLENYAKWAMTWELVEVFLPDSTIRESLNLFRELVLGKPSMDEQQKCVKIVDKIFPIALGRVYAEHLLPQGYKEAGIKLVAGVREGLKQRMVDDKWLDDVTRQRSIEKLEAIQSRVAYPDMTFNDTYLNMLYGMYKFNKTQYVQNFLEYINISVHQQFSLVYKPLDRTVWFTSPSTVNAYYAPIFNQISILEAIMRTPSFSDEWPLSVQYGALGMVVGHELTHGFDNNGRHYDKDGRRRNWWTNASIEAFKERAQCFVEQYSQYELFGIHVNGNTTLGENIADNGGVRASYDAFKQVSQKSEKLPGLTQYSDDQLFFIGFSQLWCSYSTPLSFHISVLTDEHAPGPFRIIGTLSNNEAFSEAFKCPSGSPMNPTKKCVLW